jgi:transaldolase
MRKAGVQNYEAFAAMVLSEIGDLPISFEVFSDDNSLGGGMYAQAMKIASWGDNVYVKIPITNTQGKLSLDLIHMLSYQGVKVNVTAIMTLDQVAAAAKSVISNTPSCISVFAGRIADTGRDPIPDMVQSLSILKHSAPNSELIWASPREVLNVTQADEIGCHIITVTSDILKKLSLEGKSLSEYSLETVQMFYNDAKESGYTL